jgi:hypothetical protein
VFPLSTLTYIKIAAAVLAGAVLCYSGYHIGHSEYVTYKKEVAEASKKQEALNESLRKQQQLVTKGKDEDYNSKISLIKQYYANGVRNSSSNPMQSVSLTSSLADASTKYNVLAADCAETTQQLITLQEWIKAQMGL